MNKPLDNNQRNREDTPPYVDELHRDAPLVYAPRSTIQKLLPALIFVSLLALYFTYTYVISEKNESLLSAQFLLGVPFFIGAIAVLFANYNRPIATTRVFVITFWLTVGLLILSIPLGEGIICIIMASPILYIAMLIGGIIMNIITKKIWKTKALYSVVILPLLILFVPIEPSPQTYHVTHSTVINATPEEVFQSINHIDNITPQEFYQESKLLPFMQVPTPKSAITVLEEGKWVRKCEWHQGITFDEPLISQIPNRQLRWQFVFHPNSVPPKALDDHVTINGKHFKLLHGQYDLKPLNDNATELTFNVTYRITTNINFYAGFWGEWVMDEFVTDTLGLYKRRLESPLGEL